MVRKNTLWDMIPKDWDVVVLGKYSEISRGGSPRPIQDYLTSSCRGINWIKIGDVSKSSKYIFSAAEKIIPEGVSKSRTVFCGDLILSNSMSFGRPYILKIDGCIHDGWLVIQNYQSAFDKEYLYYCLGSEFTIQQYISMAAGSSVQNLNKVKVSAVIIAKPPIQEQVAIAEALSDVDSLISSLQKLIEKKKAIKRGAMRELLTGKKRLPGFSGEWSNLRIEEIANLHDNLRVPVEKSMREKGNIPYYGANGIQDYVNGYTHNGSYVLIAEDGANDLQEYPIRYASGKMWVNNHVHVLDGKNSVSDTRFLSYSMSTIDYQAAITGGTRAKLNGHILMQLALDLPLLAEQQAIAQVLSDMDSEIEQLKKKLSKYQQIKQGMMQELFTGRIRITNY